MNLELEAYNFICPELLKCQLEIECIDCKVFKDYIDKKYGGLKNE